jgi:AcrR family transcriptional regulator
MKPVTARVGRPLVYTPEQLIDRLVQTVVDLLAECGPDADLSVAHIAARAKVSKRTIYTGIASKEELIALVIARDAQSVTGMLDTPVSTAQEARALLARFLAQWALMACGPTAVGIFAMAIRERSRYPAIGAAYQRSRAEFGFSRLAAWLASMRDRRLLAVENPDLAAEFLLTTAASERQRKLALAMEAPMSEAELAERVAAILRLVLPAQLQ